MIKPFIQSFNEYTLNEAKSNHPAKYKAPEGSSRDAKLDKAQALLKSGKKEQAYKLRDEMEKKERSKPDWKNTPRKDSQVDEAKKAGKNLSKKLLQRLELLLLKKVTHSLILKENTLRVLALFTLRVQDLE